MESGVYQIKNLIDGNVYVGSTQDLKGRKSKHLRMLKNNNHHSNYLQNAYNKYGKENFEFSVIEYCENYLEVEQLYLEKLNPVYNSAKNALAPMKGRKHSDESKKKIGESIGGKKHPCFNTDINEALKSKELMLQGLTYKQIERLVKLNNRTLQRIRQGTHVLSPELGGGFKEWQKI